MIKVLIVDDIQENLYLLESLLKGSGYITSTATNGAEALSLALKNSPDIIISDILMPVMDGYSLCREWKKNEQLKNIPFVFYTATYTNPKDEDFAISLGADMFILKPQEPDVFIAKIKKVLTDNNIHELKAHKPIALPEELVLKEYNEVLIRKLEDRMLKSEESEKQLRAYATQLEEEIEHRKQITKALEESEEKFRITTENSSDAIFITDKQRRFLYINDQATHLLGYSITEMLEMTIADIAPKNEVKEHLQLFQKLLDDGKLFVEIQMLKKDGGVVPVDLNAVVLPNGMVYGSCRDITKRKITEEELIKSEQRFRTLAESAPVGIFRTDAKGETKYVNPRWCEITQLSFEEALGNGWLQVVHPDDRVSLDELWKQATQTSTSSNVEYRFMHKDGSIAWVIGHAIPQKDEKGTIIGYIGTITDITDRKLMEADLIVAKDKAVESDNLKTSFLHNISHEIRTPMNAIVGFSELLTEPNLTTEKCKNFVDIIVQSSNQLLSIVNNIISISTIEAGQEKIYNKEFGINTILQSLHVQFTKKIEEKNTNLILKLHLPDNELKIISDETKLIQILTNLIDNAIKFTKQGYVNFGYDIKENELEFFVEDSGIGIPAENQNEVFDRFRQVKGIDQQFGGTGLGLSISKGYVELMGGKVWLISELNKGSKFYFTIPYKKVHKIDLEEKLTSIGVESEIEASKTILIAEDEDSNFMLLEELLSDLKANIIRAVNGIEAVNICKLDQKIDLILMDIKMPLMNGDEATKQIKAFMPEIPIIAQTAYSTEVEKEKILAYGCNDFIIKPIRRELLIAKIKEHLVGNKY